MESPLILVIDDSLTIRKMVECHLSQAGYRVIMAAAAEPGLEMARADRPDLILLDHQLPGTTGDEVCRALLAREETAAIPVVISSALRNRAFAQYTEFTNVVDQIPKPFTPELLRSGVANALQTGAMVVQAQRTGCAMPEAVGEARDATLEGTTAAFPLRAVLDFLNHARQSGRLTVEAGRDRIRFAVSGGRVQAVYSTTVGPEAVEAALPAELADLAPLLALTLGEQQDPSMSGLVRMLERSLSDPRRLRALLRCQAAALTYRAIEGEPGPFAFEPDAPLPPMFQAMPLQTSVAALIVEGVRACGEPLDADEWGRLAFARQAARGGSTDRTGLSNGDVRVLTLLDGSRPLREVAEQAGMGLPDVAATVRGFELAGMVERRTLGAGESILAFDEDPEAAALIQRVLGPEGADQRVKVVRDRVAAQLLLRRQSFNLVILPLDRPEHEAFFRLCKQQCPPGTRFIGIASIEDESELARLDAMGLDGVLHRPLNEADLTATVKHLLTHAPGSMAGVA
ncbi:Transcriptional regulatory protein AfsQ1 [Aquisphaera giovannonii]|uniref:Transcriptional regulatory protein AfsQ1 n=1 Tax=Aquisphaera giovannonii TaxID=406548 RepID=A0A5B9WCF6_9BACT|nr:response regulator [Aquisphaera giovannonii]QEH38262.1 Transcriptional regulatory protein AfsQ1 [Aquisphaera giovannonii]